MVDAGWEVASHGWRWIDYGEFSEDEEREHMQRAIDDDRASVRRSAGRLVHRPRDGEHAAAGRGGGRLPLRLGRLLRRAALLGRGRGHAAPRDPVHAGRERLQVPDPERLRDRRRLLRLPRGHVRAALRGGRPDDVGRPALPDRRPPGPRAGARPLPRAREAARGRLGDDARRDRPPLARQPPGAGRGTA